MFHSVRVRVRLADTTAWTNAEISQCVRRLAQFEPGLLVDVAPEAAALRHAAAKERVATTCRLHAHPWVPELASPAPTIARLLVSGVENAAALIAHLYDGGSIVVLEVSEGLSLPLPPGAWACHAAGIQEPVAFEVDSTGYAVRGDRAGARRSTSAPIWTLDVEQIRRELALERSPDEGVVVLPAHDPITLTDGRVWRRYAEGGTMAMGHSRAQADAMAALGFDDEGAFRSWARNLQRGAASAEHDFPSLVSAVPFGGAFVDDDGATAVRQVPKVDGRIVLAGLLATRDFETARAFLGLGASRLDTEGRVGLEHLTPGDLATALRSTRNALAEALFVMALSGMARRTRVSMATLLPLLGVEKARILAREIEMVEPDIGGPATRAFGNAAARRRLNRPSTDTVSARGYVDEVLAKLEQILGGEK